MFVLVAIVVIVVVVVVVVVIIVVVVVVVVVVVFKFWVLHQMMNPPFLPNFCYAITVEIIRTFLCSL